MFTLTNAEYHGVKFDFSGDTKQDLVEALAGIDYYLARANAPLSSEARAGDKEAEATPEKAEAPQEDKPKSNRRRSTAKKDKPAKQEKEAETEKEAEPEKEAAGNDKTEDTGKAADDTPAETKAPTYTVEEVKARLQEYIDAFGAVQAKELLGRYDVKKRSELTDEQLPKFMAEMEDRMEAGG